MSKFILLYASLVFSAVTFYSPAQPLRDINYEYMYDPNSLVSFHLRPVRGLRNYTVLFELEVKDTVEMTKKYTVEWEGRTLLGDKEGVPLTLDGVSTTRADRGYTGHGTIPRAQAPRFLVARVTHHGLQRAWLFYTALEPEFPVDDFLMRDGSAVTESWIKTNVPVRIASDSGSWVVSYYEDDFPAAAPAFSEAQARVSPVIRPDSVFSVSGEALLSFPLKGLYLLQRDTVSIRGFAFRAEDDYPQYSKLANLAGPLMYISTRQEFARLSSAGTNKKAFDRVILGMTADTDRARTLMRNYFRRVELANRYFTSYKEGWKSDRGMIYIIFGKPDAIYRLGDREVWNYNTQFKIRFDFARSGSLFDPDNYVLIRDKKYEDTWYEVIDLWRNARF